MIFIVYTYFFVKILHLFLRKHSLSFNECYVEPIEYLTLKRFPNTRTNYLGTYELKKHNLKYVSLLYEYIYII